MPTTRKTHWKQDPEAVKSDILKVAVDQFSHYGLSGARIDEIGRLTASSKRMIYYYFTDKEGLYRAALESEYRRVRTKEAELDLSGLNPVDAMRRLVEFTYDYHRQNPNFVRMISIENVHGAAYLEHSNVVRELNQKVVDKVGDIYRSGVEAGLFRDGLNPLELHWIMSALSFYNVSNKHTFAAGFGPDLHSDLGQSALRTEVVNVVLRTILTPEAAAQIG